MKLTLEEIEVLRANPSRLLRGMDEGREWAFETFHSLLDSARALARLEATANSMEGESLGQGAWSVRVESAHRLREWPSGLDLAAAIHQALDGAEAAQ